MKSSSSLSSQSIDLTDEDDTPTHPPALVAIRNNLATNSRVNPSALKPNQVVSRTPSGIFRGMHIIAMK